MEEKGKRVASSGTRGNPGCY